MSDQIVIEETGDVLEVLEGTGDALTLLYKALDPATFTAPADNVMPQFDAASDSWQAVALTLAWADITGTPTTLAGYGITDGATDAELAAHTSLTNNPHTVTSAQVGLGSVEDVALSTWAGSANVTTVGTLTSLAVAGALTATGGVDGVLGGVTPAAATVTTLIVSGAGPHAYGSIDPDAFLRLNTAFTGASTNVAGLQFDATLTPPLNGVAWAVVLSPTLVEGASGTHSDFGTLKVRPPSVTPGGATVTNLTTFKVTAPPSGGVNNRAFWVVSGLSEVDVLTVTGALTASGGVDGVVGGVTPAAGSFTTLIVSDDVTVNGSSLAVSNDTNPKVRLSDSSPGGVSVEFQAISTQQANFGTTTNHPLWFVTNNQVQLGINAAGNLLFGSTGDVALFRGAANRLDLASGDSFAILDGHLAVGGTTSSNILAFLAGTHPSVEVGLQVQPTLQPDAGGATAIVHVLGSITEAASGTHSFLAGARITAPTVTPGAATVTHAATLYVDGTISATVTGRKEALYVGGTSYFSSTVEIDGAFNHDGSTFGALGATPQAQQAHIVDADGTLADITTKFNTLLANLYEGFGFGAAA